eukprot:7097851-Ditylum_brightwellii.AAC.1
MTGEDIWDPRQSVVVVTSEGVPTEEVLAAIGMDPIGVVIHLEYKEENNLPAVDKEKGPPQIWRQ